MPPAPPPPSVDWAYFFDIDGTLADLAPTPEQARLRPVLQRRVLALRAATGGAVAVVSGRPLRDIDRLFHPTLLAAAGQHGAERRDASGVLSRRMPMPKLHDEALRLLSPFVARHPGLRLEDKGASLALHYRARPALAGVAHRTMHAVQRKLGAEVEVQGGKRLVELVAAGTSKGAAVRAFLGEAPFRGRRPVFLGDDTSDEAAFAAVATLGGLGIKVGAGPTGAACRLASVSAVTKWLAAFDFPFAEQGASA